MRGRPVWFQLYARQEWEATHAMVKRVEASGCPVLALTIDIPTSNREVLARFRRESIVSNHGGRSEDSGRSTIECLPEVIGAVAGRVPVIVDSGFRRGTDIFKALALGADAIAIGRPYLWGLASFGQEGVETVLDLLARKLEIVMMQAGTVRIADIGRSHIA